MVSYGAARETRRLTRYWECNGRRSKLQLGVGGGREKGLKDEGC